MGCPKHGIGVRQYLRGRGRYPERPWFAPFRGHLRTVDGRSCHRIPRETEHPWVKIITNAGQSCSIHVTVVTDSVQSVPGKRGH